MSGFDDFLGVGEVDFSRVQLTILVGASGSGKSTIIRHLLEHHDDFRGRRSELFRGPPFDRRKVGSSNADLLVFDELSEIRDLRPLFSALSDGKRCLAAAHLPRFIFHALGVRRVVRSFRTDRGEEKIARYLSRLGLSFSEEAVVEYVRRYGSVYTEVDLIRERHPGADFDAMMNRFHRFARLERR